MKELWAVVFLGVVGWYVWQSNDVSEYEAFVAYMEKGSAPKRSDYWIEMQSLYGDWERTGLVFGYTDNLGECQKAIDGLKAVNYERDYRCSSVSANR